VTIEEGLTALPTSWISSTHWTTALAFGSLRGPSGLAVFYLYSIINNTAVSCANRERP
tara:strand:- start:2452 stop:2625 length:174 start_codon:yes stop_codon:yes gene_type:complete